MNVEQNTIGPNSGRLTSWLASLDNAQRNGGQRLRVLRAFEQLGPMTDEEMQARLSMPANTQRPRRVELSDWGLISEYEYGVTRTGNRAVRWQINEEGIRVLRRRRSIEQVSA